MDNVYNKTAMLPFTWHLGLCTNWKHLDIIVKIIFLVQVKSTFLANVYKRTCKVDCLSRTYDNVYTHMWIMFIEGSANKCLDWKVVQLYLTHVEDFCIRKYKVSYSFSIAFKHNSCLGLLLFDFRMIRRPMWIS